jgi:hypothetical protein
MIYDFLTGRRKTEIGTTEQTNEECRSLEELILNSDFDCSKCRFIPDG